MPKPLTDKQARILRNAVAWQREHGVDAELYLFAEDRAAGRALIKRGLLAVDGEDDRSPPQFVRPTQAGLERASAAPKTEDRHV